MERSRGVLAAGVGSAVLGLGLLPSVAGAESRTVQVTLIGGKTFTVTVDVPSGVPVSQIHLPGIKLPVLSIVEVGAPAGTPTVQVPGLPAPEPAKDPVPAPAPGPDVSVTGDAPVAAGQQAQRTTGKRVRRTATATPAPRDAARPMRKRRVAVAPSRRDPSYSVALPGPALVGVPDFFIDKFRIPPFLLPIYQAAGVQYGVRWEVLAAINEIETDYGRNLSVSSAGAEGWMQFMPATWKTYGLDANDDGKRDPYNPVDAIFSAARYLKAAGAEKDIRKAVFAYNHADWYVDSVLMRARLIGGAPAELVGSLTGLTQGRFPVAAKATYAQGRAATNIFTRAGAAVVAVQDAKVTHLGAHTVVIRDAYGNSYTYARLAKVARSYVLPARRKAKAPARVRVDRELPASKQRLFARAGRHATTGTGRHGAHRLRVGSRVPGGTVLGRVGRVAAGTAPFVKFKIKPAGRGTPYIDPKPILDGWKLLERTAIYRAKGANALLSPDAKNPTIGQILLMTKGQLTRRVLADPKVTIYSGGREDIRSGQIDRRVLATLEFLAASGLKPTVSSLKGNHGFYTASGNVSEHSSGNAVDISAINGIPILGHQGPGSITDITNRRLLTLQGVLKPHQIISLMTYQGTDNTLALPDHDDHIHVGFRPDAITVLKPLQWTKLIDRLAKIDNPTIDPS